MKLYLFLLLMSNAYALESTSDLGNNYYLIMGGSSSPFNLEVSVENNMLIMDKALSFYNRSENIIKLFGGGKDPEVVDVIEQRAPIDLDDEIFLGLLSSKIGYGLTLRHNNIAGLQGEMSSKTFFEATNFLQDKTTAKDKLSIYFTGHGGYRNDDFLDNYMVLWGKKGLPVSEFTKKLDVLDEKLQVQVVMAQCYPGGFAQINYKGGTLRNAVISNHNRCGFFAQTGYYPSSGCDRVLYGSDYGYSHYFLAAYLGYDGDTKINADYDGNGLISSNEANAYAVLNDPSASDMPTTTSSAFVRDVMKGSNFRDFVGEDSPSFYTQFPETVFATWNDIAKLFDPVEVKLVEAFKKDLEKFWPANYQNLNIDEFKAQMMMKLSDFILDNKLDNEVMIMDAAIKSSSTLLARLSDDLNKQYSISDYDYESLYPDRINHDLLSPNTISSMRSYVLSHNNYSTLRDDLELFYNIQNNAKQKELQTARFKFFRLIYFMHTKTLEHFLRSSSRSEILKKYEELRFCESQSFF